MHPRENYAVSDNMYPLVTNFDSFQIALKYRELAPNPANLVQLIKVTRAGN